MDRKELFNELWRRNFPEDTRRYSFEVALSIIQFATEDREYEDKNVHIIMTRTLDGDVYELKWKN